MSGLEEIAAAALPAAIQAGETELAKGLAGLLGQVYGDTISPGAKQVGAMIEDVVKTVRLLAFPLQYGAVFQDRFRRDLTTAMESVAPPDRQVPSVKLFSDCCDGSKFEEEPVLRAMWLQLLSRGCDIKRSGEAHPAFAGYIRQISADEALILSALYPHSSYTWSELEARTSPFGAVSATELGIRFAGSLQFYHDHLISLGLMFGIMLHERGNVLMIDDCEFMQLTAVGRAFVTAVNSHPTSGP